MIPVMVKEADLNRIDVPEDYEVLDATALGRRLGSKHEYSGRRGRGVSGQRTVRVVGQPQPDGESILVCKVHRHPPLRLIVGNP
jgi:hypothetical protein